MKSSLEYLNKLKEDYAASAVSVLVGAGFSKNAISDYPMWKDMLYDLIKELYGKRLSERFYEKKSYEGPILGYDEFIRKEMDSIVSEVGYLNLVSKYVETKGYREAIDVYIEHHMPYVKETASGFEVKHASKTSFTKKNLDTHLSLLNCNWKQVFTTNYDNLLELTAKTYNLSYKTITSDYQLKELSSSRGIIKIHGSLVEDSLDASFEFDNDKSRRYIISKEDYDTYADRHQAFSYLMRTSLLTGVFCLVGFSGDDPNFLGWLEWMKDVLDRDYADKEKEEIKIYLLTIGNGNISLDRQLFYQNHRIAVINILDKELHHEIGLDPNTDVSVIFQSIFRYIRNAAQDREQLIDENDKPQEKKEYERKWQLVANTKDTVTAEDIAELRSLRNEALPTANTGSQQFYMSHFYTKKGLTVEQLTAFAIAANDSGLMPRMFPRQDSKGILNNIPEWQEMQRWEDAFVKMEVSGTSRDGDFDRYLSILCQRYQFQSEKAKELLDEWTPSGRWIIAKASLFGEYDQKAAVDMLDDLIAHTGDSQVKYLASIMSNIMSQRFPLRYSYDEFKTIGLKGYWDVSKAILEKTYDRKEKMLPYGVTSRQFAFSVDTTTYTESLRYVMFLAKTGFMLQYRMNTMVNAEDWYRVFRNVYEVFPYPCLYYSLQITTRNVIRRIGQDFAYSLALKDTLPDVLRRLLNILANDRGGYTYSAIFYVCEQLMIAVDEEVWFEDYKKIFKEHFLPDVMTITSIDAIQSFIQAGAHYLSNKEHIAEMFDEVLDNFNVSPTLLSALAERLKLERTGTLTNDQKEKLMKIVAERDIDVVTHLLSCVYEAKMTDAGLQNAVSEKIIINQSKLGSMSIRMFYALTHFAANHPEALHIVKEAILNRDIWNCGIEGTSGQIPSYLALNKIDQEVTWTTEEQGEIMKNLVQNLSKLEQSPFFDHDFFGREYFDLLLDMKEYLERKVPSSTENTSIIKRVDDLLKKVSGTAHMFDVLYDKQTNISDTLQYLARCVDYDGCEAYRPYIDVIIDRALLVEKKNLNMVLSFVAFLAEKHTDYLLTPQTLVKIKLMLDKYTDLDYREAEIDLPYAYVALRTVAKALYGRGHADDTAVRYWLTDKDVNRFNLNLKM